MADQRLADLLAETLLQLPADASRMVQIASTMVKLLSVMITFPRSFFVPASASGKGDSPRVTGQSRTGIA